MTVDSGFHTSALCLLPFAFLRASAPCRTARWRRRWRTATGSAPAAPDAAGYASRHVARTRNLNAAAAVASALSGLAWHRLVAAHPGHQHRGVELPEIVLLLAVIDLDGRGLTGAAHARNARQYSSGLGAWRTHRPLPG
jgi:hypothetical protein